MRAVRVSDQSSGYERQLFSAPLPGGEHRWVRDDARHVEQYGPQTEKRGQRQGTECSGAPPLNCQAPQQTSDCHGVRQRGSSGKIFWDWLQYRGEISPDQTHQPEPNSRHAVDADADVPREYHIQSYCQGQLPKRNRALCRPMSGPLF